MVSIWLKKSYIRKLENQLTGFSLYYSNTKTLGGTCFNSLFSLPFKLTKTEEILICRYVDTDPQRHSYKKVFQTYAANSHESVPARASLINLLHALITTSLIALPCFSLLNCKSKLQVV